jgi:hypothetical protein
MGKQLKRPTNASPVQNARLLAETVDVVNGLQKTALGPGMTGRMTRSGVAIFSAPAGTKSVPQAVISGTPKALGATQGSQDTDTYDVETDDVPVQLDIPFDFKYDPATHQFTYRTRTIVATGIISVSAESDLITVTTAVECPCV